MSIRGIVRQATVAGVASTKNAPIFIDSDDNILYTIPAGSGTTVVAQCDVSSVQTLTNKTLTTPTIASSATFPVVKDATGAGLRLVAGGTGAMVSGTITITTGLTQILGMTANVVVQPNATGALSPQILVVAPGTGASGGSGVVTAYFISSGTGATTIASGSSGTVAWTAFGT